MILKLGVFFFPPMGRTCEYNFDALVKTVSSYSPSIIGVQVLTNSYADIVLFIERIHAHFPNLNIILGGPHCSIMYTQILSKYPYVIVVIGEGEKVFLELAKMLLSFNNSHLYEIKGIAFMDQDRVVKTADSLLIESLDLLPFPKVWWDWEKALDHFPIMTARGCPGNCLFCFKGVIAKQKVRYRSIHNIIQELIHIKNNYPGVRVIRIIDDAFLFNEERVIAFCDEVIRHDLGFKYTCFGLIHSINDKVVNKMVLAGFELVNIGIESANEAIRLNIGKRFTNKDIYKALNLLAERSVRVELNFIVGLPGETWRTLRETGLLIQSLQRLKKLSLSLNINIAEIYPGTGLYMKMKRFGFPEDLWTDIAQNHVYYTLEYSSDNLLKMYNYLLAFVDVNSFFTIPGFFRQRHVVLFFFTRLKAVRRCLIKWREGFKQKT